jgi:hypothetical protein
MHNLLLGRDPIDGEPLAAQATISRFENHVGSQALYAMGRALAATHRPPSAAAAWAGSAHHDRSRSDR